uniref:Uncharacterized protein n=1 Tax=Pyramimonas orientalis virus TaxID=455367 RepID=A0A7L9AXK5_POV01|nr:hypothetical protein HWQ62_00172 [Pyramimonas orientalis virus]
MYYSQLPYYVEQDDFFNYVKEYLKEESTHTYYKQFYDKDDYYPTPSTTDNDTDSDNDGFEFY